jgi:hypothetical protein
MDHPEGKALYDAIRELHGSDDLPLRYALGRLWVRGAGFETTKSKNDTGLDFVDHAIRKACNRRR